MNLKDEKLKGVYIEFPNFIYQHCVNSRYAHVSLATLRWILDLGLDGFVLMYIFIAHNDLSSFNAHNSLSIFSSWSCTHTQRVDGSLPHPLS